MSEEKKKKMTIDKEYRILKALGNIFYDNQNTTTPTDDYYSAVDLANVCMVEAKSEEGKKWLLRFLDLESKRTPPKNLDFKAEALQEQKVKVSTEYLLKVIKVLEATSDAINITTKKDYPILLENEHFKFIFTPRIEADE